MANLAGEGRVEKRFRVATEGQTVDSRQLSRQEIQEMADTYNLEHYGARVNVEHYLAMSPNSDFKAFGDIIKVEAIEENGKLCLYNTVSALPNLIELNKAGQKIYPSIEFYRNFAGSNKAYQVGLALTDQPASLGTQSIKFNSNQFTLRTHPDKEIFMSGENTQEEKTFFQQLKEVLSNKPAPAPHVENLDETVAQALVQAFNLIKDLGTQVTALSNQVAAPTPTTENPAPTPTTENPAPTPDAFSQALQPLKQGIEDLQNKFNKLSSTPVNNPPSITGNQVDSAPY